MGFRWLITFAVNINQKRRVEDFELRTRGSRISTFLKCIVYAGFFSLDVREDRSGLGWVIGIRKVWIGRRRGLGPASGDENDGDPLDVSSLSLTSKPCGKKGACFRLNRRTTDRLPLSRFPAPEQDLGLEQKRLFLEGENVKSEDEDERPNDK
ncbi:hypothetical protein Syun_001398 [Stephania yunnanensis]|uniref:Uncharacterized protein n=1 Tax=Stephania yunnanensis TaxID=152371 RepID=A0AAP0LDS6_9MAGN